MDSEHRHELKTNELADWVAHFPDFCRRNARTIIGVVLIAAAVVVYVYGKSMRSESRHQRQSEAVMLIEQLGATRLNVVRDQQQDMDSGDAIMIAANRLEMAVNESKAPKASALLLIKHAEALRTDLHYRPAELDAEIIEQRVKEARQAYERALPLTEGNPTLAAMARFGIGLCAEEVGNYIEAEEIYNRIISDPDLAATVFPVQAQQRLDNMADNRMQFVFVSKPAPMPEPETTISPITIPQPAQDIVIGDAPPTDTVEILPPQDAPPSEVPQPEAANEEAPPTSGQADESSDDM